MDFKDFKVIRERKRKRRGVSSLSQVLGNLARKLSCAQASPAHKEQDITLD